MFGNIIVERDAAPRSVVKLLSQIFQIDVDIIHTYTNCNCRVVYQIARRLAYLIVTVIGRHEVEFSTKTATNWIIS